MKTGDRFWQNGIEFEIFDVSAVPYESSSGAYIIFRMQGRSTGRFKRIRKNLDESKSQAQPSRIQVLSSPQEVCPDYWCG